MSNNNSAYIVQPPMVSISKRGPSQTRTVKHLICCCEYKTWISISAIFEIIVCVLALIYFLTLYSKDNTEKNAKTENIKLITETLLISAVLSNGIVSGCFLFIGAQCKSACLLGMWLTVEVLTIIGSIAVGIVFREEIMLGISFLAGSFNPTLTNVILAVFLVIIVLIAAVLVFYRFKFVYRTCRQYASR